MQFHGGVYRSDDAGETWTDIAPGLPSDFGFPLAIDPADPDSAYVIPLIADIDRVTPERARARVRDARRRRDLDAARRRPPARAGVPDDPARGVRLDRRGRRRSSSTSARRREPCSARPTRVRAGSTWRRTCRRCSRSARQTRRSGISTVTVVPLAGRGVDRRTARRARRCGRAARAGRLPETRSAPPTPSSRISTRRQSSSTRDVNERLAGLGVLGDVGQRLGGDEVGGGLDRVTELGDRPRR